MRILDFIVKDNIGNPPWDYYFLKNLDKKEYPKYLAKLLYIHTGEKLPLKFDFSGRGYFSTRRQGLGNWIIDKKKCKTFNQKIQWIKLHGITDLMRKCTDKVAVRDYVAEKIGEEYLKPVLQVIPSLNCDCHVIARNNSTLGDEAIQKERSSRVDFSQPKQDVSTYFDKIDWENLPNSFVIKCNHGCKWHYIIKDKEAFLQNKRLFDIVKRNITGWLEQDYSFWSGFEMQYKTAKLNHNVIASKSTSFQDLRGNPADLKEQNKSQSDCHVKQNAVVPRNDKYIDPKILIEPLLRNDINKNVEQVQVYCFLGIPKLILRFNEGMNKQTTLYDEKLNIIDDVFSMGDININKTADDLINQSFDLSKKLSKDFMFVRVDWMIFNKKTYFEELTFTPYSGLKSNLNKKINILLGDCLKSKN